MAVGRSYDARHRRTHRPGVVATVVALVAGAGSAVVLPVLTGTATAVVPVPSAVTDINPNATPSPLFGGRVEKLAIDPLDPQKLWAGTELGGLWRSTNGGGSWSHVDAVPLARVQDVTVATSDPSLIVAVGIYDGSTVSQGGVWRSTDGGATWSKPAGSDPPGACTTESSGLSVAIGAGTPGALPVFVGDSCGLTRSNTSGASGWTRLDPDGAFDSGSGAHQIEDIDVRPGTGSNIQVDVCGPQGFFRSNDSGGTWSAADAASPTFRNATSAGIQGGAFGPCSIAVDPNNANIVYLANFEGGTASGFCAGQILENRNGGAAGSWTQMGPDVTDSNCRDPFVQTHDNPDSDTTTYDVYFGTSTRILRQTCDSDNTPSCATGAANWPRWDLNTPHTDPTSIVFDPSTPTGCPLFHGADGGVFKETGGCGATPAIAHANTGLHAYDSSQLAGTVFPGHTDLYFGTQDNGTFYTADGGTTYINNGPDTYNVLADQRGNAAASIMRRDCFGCGVFRQAPGAAIAAPFTAPPAPWNSDFGNTFAATQYAPQSYALVLRDSPPDDGVPPAEAAPNWAVFYTTNAGTNWTKLGNNLPGAPSPSAGSGPGSHGQIKWSGPAASPTFYLTIGGVLYRLSGGTLDNTVATNTATLTNVNTGLTAVTAFDVDTSDPSLLFAVSRDGGQGIYKSINGGASWAKDNAATSLVTGGGAYKWKSSLGPQATAIGIDPYSDTVLVGTMSNGILATTNNGAGWVTVRGSKQIPFVLDFVFDDVRDTAFVGSRGRGLWRLDLPEANLSITKSDSPDPVIAGEQLKYTITVTNDGPDTASAMTVVDELPPQLSYVTSSIPCVATPVAGHDHVECALPNLASGDSVTFTITTAVHADAVSDNGGPLTITNTATAGSGETTDPDAGDNTATTTTVVNDSADLEVTKLCEPTTVKAGEDARCTIYVDNHGPSDARGVVLSDTLTSDGTFTVANVAAPEGGTCATVTVPGGKRYDCDLGVIEAESTANAGRKTLTYTVSANEGQEIDNKARARSDTPDPDDTNNITSQTITVTAVADLVLTKSAPATATAGTTFDYVLTVKNNGPSTAANVKISDTLPAGVTVLTVSGTGGASCTAGVPGNPAQPTTCTFGSLPGDGTTTRTMTVNVRVNAGTTGVLHNDARASSGTFDPNTSNNLAHTDTDVLTSANLAVTKTDSPDPVVAGQAISYLIHVTSAGPSVARDVAMDDTLPSWVTFTGSTIQHGSGTCALVVGSPSHVVCQLGDLNAGDYVDVVLSGTVKSGAPSGVVLHNTVTVSSTTPDVNAANNSAFADTTVTTRADLVLNHTSDANVYKASTVIHYLITVTNSGPSDAVNVVIKDALPPLKYGSYVSNDGGCTVSGTTLTCPGVTLVAGATRNVIVNWAVQGSKGTIQATASVTSATFDPNTANNSLTRTVTRK
jgi:uncharacterized repeat protein (TIGR01451 family)